MYESKANTLFDTQIDGVIFGQGNDITGKDKFRSYAAYLGADTIRFLYCGDIDRAGFDIFLRLCKLKNKVIGTFRSLQGAKDFLILKSLTSTASKTGTSAFDAFLSLHFGRLVLED